MSYQDGWSALNLEMPARVPRTEYSADFHWDLVSRVTGISAGESSDEATRALASRAFRRAWDYSLNWNVLINTQPLGRYATNMGHAVYRQDGADYDTDVHSAFGSPEAALAFDPLEALGRPDEAALVRAFEAHYEQARAAFPEEVNMTGVYTTLVSGLIALFGWDTLLLAAADRPAFGKLTDRYAAWMQHYFDALARADVPVVMVHDDIAWTDGPFIHPDWYRAHVFPAYKRYFRPLIESGKKILYTSDGNYTAFLDDIVDTGVHGLVLEPMTDMAQIAHRYGRTHMFIGNADTRVLLRGSKAQIEAEVKRCMDIGKACPGFMLAVGNHIPPNTPVESCLWYQEAYERMAAR